MSAHLLTALLTVGITIENLCQLDTENQFFICFLIWFLKLSGVKLWSMFSGQQSSFFCEKSVLSCLIFDLSIIKAFSIRLGYIYLIFLKNPNKLVYYGWIFFVKYLQCYVREQPFQRGYYEKKNLFFVIDFKWPEDETLLFWSEFAEFRL